MFYFNYLWAELTRRWGKTLSIALGLAIGSAIIITIISISQSLSSAQDKVLNPLQNVGTDILVTRSVSTDNMRDLDETTRTEMMSENRVSTDLSKLGNPGDQFTLDTFLPGTMLTFTSSETEKLDNDLVANYATGLILNVNHQEGKIPQVTAEFQTGGETFQVERQMDSSERDAMREAMDKAQEAVRAKGLDPRSEEGRAAMNEAIKEYAPNISTEFITPERTYKQDVGSISTDIQTESFTVGGVDTSKTDIGLILPNQIINGKYFDGDGQIVVSKSYADKNETKVDDKITLGGKEFSVVGIVDPKLYTNTADIYLPLSDLQSLSEKNDRVNILLVKSSNAKNVAETTQVLKEAFTGSSVTNSQDTAKEVTGSLTSAANLTNKFILLTSIIVVLAAFIIVSLLTIQSVNKRIREIGTLKAIGWSDLQIVRQVFMENVVIGIIGAGLGIGLGILVITVLNHYDISLSATIREVATQTQGRGFMGRFLGGSSLGSTATVELQVTYTYLILLLGAAVSIIGSVLAGGFAAAKSAKMKPVAALRNIE